MKKYLYLLFTFAFAIHLNLFGKIIETAHFHEVAHYAAPDTLIIFDIDDTLLIPVQTLGTDVWFRHHVKECENKGLSSCVAFEKALSDWEAIRHLTGVKMVEEGSDRVVKDLQNKQIPVMALTTQGLAMATLTFRQLQSLNIDFTDAAPLKEDYYFINEHGVLYRHGILFTSGTPKGPALTKLLNHIGYHPKRIVFINDKASHLKDVEGPIEAMGIEFIGLRYSYSDERVNKFRPEIANIQWNFSSFGRILSDEDAEKLLKEAE